MVSRTRTLCPARAASSAGGRRRPATATARHGEGRRGGGPAGCLSLFRHGCGAGLVPDPAVEAFAERAAAGTPEQPPICGAPEGLKVPAQEAGKLRGIGTVLMAPSGRCL